MISGGSFDVVSGATALVENGTLAVNGGSISQSSAPSGQPASFFAMGTNNINLYGTDLALSGPTAGSVFETNTDLGGGFTLNPSPVPEPTTALLLLIALPAGGVALRRRCRIA